MRIISTNINNNNIAYITYYYCIVWRLLARHIKELPLGHFKESFKEVSQVYKKKLGGTHPGLWIVPRLLTHMTPLIFSLCLSLCKQKFICWSFEIWSSRRSRSNRDSTNKVNRKPQSVRALTARPHQDPGKSELIEPSPRVLVILRSPITPDFIRSAVEFFSAEEDWWRYFH